MRELRVEDVQEEFRKYNKTNVRRACVACSFEAHGKRVVVVQTHSAPSSLMTRVLENQLMLLPVHVEMCTEDLFEVTLVKSAYSNWQMYCLEYGMHKMYGMYHTQTERRTTIFNYSFTCFVTVLSAMIMYASLRQLYVVFLMPY